MTQVNKGVKTMSKVVQIVYVKKSKRVKENCIIALDDEGAIWFAKEPFTGLIDWHSLTLPVNLEYGDCDKELPEEDDDG